MSDIPDSMRRSSGGQYGSIDAFSEALKNKTYRNDDRAALWAAAKAITVEQPADAAAMSAWMAENKIDSPEQQAAYLEWLRLQMDEPTYGDDGPPPGEIVSRRAWVIDVSPNGIGGPEEP